MARAWCSIIGIIFGLSGCAGSHTSAKPDVEEYTVDSTTKYQQRIFSKLSVQNYKLKSSDPLIVGHFIFQPHPYSIDRGSAIRPLSAFANLELQFSPDKIIMTLNHVCNYSFATSEFYEPCHSDDDTFQRARNYETNKVRAEIRSITGGGTEKVIQEETNFSTPAGRLDPNVKP